ncbi:two pore potassium channel protein sup-9-like [Artemia franciscana]|uniref:two pore potassium channel protein sup-9-like n=1 Tax=Artemia franciscana TaxID=6661 RepID=UPI0032D9D770
MHQPTTAGVIPNSYALPSCSKGNSPTKCQKCFQKCKNFSCSSFGLTIIMIAYTSFGASIFLLIEGNVKNTSEKTSETEFKEITLKTVERLWTVTEDLNILYKENWTSLAYLELGKFQDELTRSVRKSVIRDRYSVPHSWSFPMALLYSLTLISTVGYGYLTPKTIAGKIFTTCYAAVGIPLFLLYLSSIGESFASVLREVRRKLCLFPRQRDRNRLKRASTNSVSNNYSYPPSLQDTCFLTDVKNDLSSQKYPTNSSTPEVVYVPISACFLLVAGYIVFGGFLFASIENWDVVDSICLCFNLLATVGFGTLIPGTRLNEGNLQETKTLSLVLFYLYIIIGMAFMATCFAALQERAAPYVLKMRNTTSCKENGSPLSEIT